MTARALRVRRIALAAWILLAASVAAWPFGEARIATITTVIAFLPLLLPLPGLASGSRRALRAAPMALAPALALAITESLANPAARLRAGLTLAFVLAAFAGVVAALRSAPEA